MEAKIRFVADHHGSRFEIERHGSYVICAITGVPIPLDKLKYWSLEKQEAYASAQAACQYRDAQTPPIRSSTDDPSP